MSDCATALQYFFCSFSDRSLDIPHTGELNWKVVRHRPQQDNLEDTDEDQQQQRTRPPLGQRHYQVDGLD